MVASLISILVVVGIFLLVVLLVRRLVGLGLSLAMGFIVVAIVAAVYIHLTGGAMPVLLHNLLTLLGNVIGAVLSVLNDIFFVGAQVTS